DAATRFKLGDDIGSHRNGDGKGYAYRPSGSGVNLRVNADHLTILIEKRPSGVARIDGNVTLNKRHIIFALLCRQTPADSANNADTCRVVETKRRADSYHPLPHLEVVSRGESHRRQRLIAVHFQ